MYGPFFGRKISKFSYQTGLVFSLKKIFCQMFLKRTGPFNFKVVKIFNACEGTTACKIWSELPRNSTKIEARRRKTSEHHCTSSRVNGYLANNFYTARVASMALYSNLFNPVNHCKRNIKYKMWIL